MSEALTELEALREATRVRLNPEAVRRLRDLANVYAELDREAKRLSTGLNLLLDMHDRLEAIRHGQS